MQIQSSNEKRHRAGSYVSLVQCDMLRGLSLLDV